MALIRKGNGQEIVTSEAHVIRRRLPTGIQFCLRRSTASSVTQIISLAMTVKLNGGDSWTDAKSPESTGPTAGGYLSQNGMSILALWRSFSILPGRRCLIVSGLRPACLYIKGWNARLQKAPRTSYLVEPVSLPEIHIPFIILAFKA